MERREWFATLAILATVVCVAVVLLVAYRLGVVSLSALVGYIIEGVIIAGAVAIIGLVAKWGFGPRVRRWIGRRGVVDLTPPIAVQVSVPPIGLSEDKKVEILERHRQDYRDRVLKPLSSQPALLGRNVGLLTGEPQPWDELYVSYDPAKSVAHSSDLDNAHLRNDIGDYAKTFGMLTNEAKLLWSETDAWRQRVRMYTEKVMESYAPIEHAIVGPPKDPFVSLDGSERRVVRAWRGIVFPRLPTQGAVEDFTPPLLSPEEAAPVRKVADGLWSCDGVTVSRPPAGKSIMEWQGRVAAIIAESTLFMEYASLRRRRLTLDSSVERLRAQMSEFIALIDRDEYHTILPCCLERISPLPSTVGGAAQPQVLSISESKPVLDLVPLPHKKGHVIAPRGRGRVQGSKRLDVTATDQDFSDPEAAEAVGSQRWDKVVVKGKFLATTRWNDLRSPKHLFYLKFGVIRVHASGAQASECRADIRFRTLKDPSGTSALNAWISGGHLNWYDEDIRTAFLEDARLLRRLARHPAYGINRHVTNQEVNIPKGGFRDLQLFYTVNDDPGVFMCGSPPVRKAATFSGRKQAKFEVEITIFGRDIPVDVRVFHVTALPDDFAVVRTR